MTMSRWTATCLCFWSSLGACDPGQLLVGDNTSDGGSTDVAQLSTTDGPTGTGDPSDAPAGAGDLPDGPLVYEPKGIICPEYRTLADMDRFFVQRCGVNVACHTAALPWSDLKTPNVWLRMLDKAPVSVCAESMMKMIDKVDPEKSLILLKVNADPMMSKCSNPRNELWGDPMPPPLQKQNIPVKSPPLTAEERACIRNFVHVAAGFVP